MTQDSDMILLNILSIEPVNILPASNAQDSDMILIKDHMSFLPARFSKNFDMTIVKELVKGSCQYLACKNYSRF